MTGEDVRRDGVECVASGTPVVVTGDDRRRLADADGVTVVAGDPVAPTDAVLADPATGEPTVSAADGRHLRGVLLASLCGGSPVGTTTLADRLGVAPPTVTERVTALADRGLLAREPYVGVELTDRGERVARAAQWRGCVVQRFFEAAAGVRLPSRRAYRIGVTLPPTALRRIRDRLADGDGGGDSSGGGDGDPTRSYCDATAPDDCPRVDCVTG